MNQNWHSSPFENGLKNLNQPFGRSIDPGIDNVNLNSMIGDFMQSEQYPYHLNLNDSLTELSPEETEQFLEDAFSFTSSKSPLSDDLTESSLSTENSPATQHSDDLLCMSYLTQDVKQEELSPATNSMEFRNPLENASLPVTLNGTLRLGDSGSEVGSFLHQSNITANNSQDLSSLLTKSSEISLAQLDDSICAATSPLSYHQVNMVGRQVTEPTLRPIETKSTSNEQQPAQLVNLLQNGLEAESLPSTNVDPPASQKKRASKPRKQKVNDPKVPKQTKVAKPQSEELESNSVDIKNESSSQSVSQVVMIPQVVFTGRDVSTSQPITAYLATSSKQVMTTVPIKIVSSNSIEMEKIPITPIGKKNPSSNLKRKSEKCGRKTNHNEVEKRYRESITTSLEDLKELVFGHDTKSTKAGILRKAMDHIKYLRKINQRLKQENMRLKMAQKQTSLVDLVQNHSNNSHMHHNLIEDIDADVCSEDEDIDLMEEELQSRDSGQSSAATSPSSVESVQANGTFSILNKQRFFLSMFMFAFMFLGPGKLLFGTKDGLSPDYDTPHTGGRTILSVNKDAENDGFKAYTSVIVNSILYLLFFAWLLIKGEPRFPRDSKNVASFKAYMNKADSEAVKGDAGSAKSCVERGLQVIGRPWSSSKIDVIPSLIWHFVCHVLHQIGILSLLKNLGWLILPRRLSAAEAKSRYRNSCSLASQAYAKLLQLELIGNQGCKLTCLKLALAAINMAENADEAVSSEHVMKIYLHSAIMMRMKFGVFSKLFMRYLISRANALLAERADDLPESLAWVFHPLGHQYVLSEKWSLEGFHSDRSSIKEPLEHVKQSFILTQVESALGQIVAPASNELDIQATERCLSVLKQCGSDNDDTVSFWHSLLSVVFYIGVGMKEKARETWESLDCCADYKATNASDLYDLVDCYFDTVNRTAEEEVEARLLIVEENILKNFAFDEGRRQQTSFFQLLTAACADMALSVRIARWEHSRTKSMTVDQLERFDQNLSILKALSCLYAPLINKVKYFNEAMRVMAGVNPVGLTKGLLRNRRHDQTDPALDTKTSIQNEEFQNTKIMLFVIKHLPSIVAKCYPTSCIAYLQRVGLTLEKSGLTEMTEDCKKVLATLKAS